MGYAFTPGDVEFLQSPEGAAALTEVGALALTTSTRVADIGWARTRFGSHVALLVETVLLRRKAAAKLPGTETWFFTDDALQQATPCAVAAHRAMRLTDRDVHDVTCSIGAELDAVVGTAATVIGSDLDPVRLLMAQHNVPGATVLRADALVPCTRGTVVLADPARRSGGRRTHDPAALEPPLPDLIETYRGRDLAVKCAPGLDFDRLGWDGEVEVVSLDGGVREACLWSPGLSGAGVTRRATVLGSDDSAWTVTDSDNDDIPERAPGEWIVDPDGAVVRAGLVRHYAARHGLWQLDPRIAYLTGDSVPDGVRGFRILEQVKYSEKSLRQELVRHDCGVAEILVRGVDVDPAVLRPKLKLRGSRSLSVVITRIGRAGVAFICAARP
ncbi:MULTISPECIES: THUMP-like domain-containing protein [unclassified Rhodococcus (in: high G+C Gram-positive bacteria)]|uniref:THUMP-like domain-containing protein n=1 Tax=unclassified Rhodococcus (in: high G+C Gram-positive bacteria) TaxID=192944 RepID=UPI00163A4708|nr:MULTISPECIES: class I SAM-dependent methyltransferase [unclassified Rhodococcus (in: high G+C Gram-positive bacteria)]MBC2643649.1 class I SAM-dependent methyltransferase [Rhodococcus sp. 3A]MBC2891610.1 class I SAM-dependent methyltransferase [Rhodococcus sp. 4CII]